MKTTRTYPAVCNSCGGGGYIPNPQFNPNVTMSTSMTCPACLGSGVITVSEVTEMKGVIISGRPNPMKVNPYETRRKSIKRH